MILQAKNIRSFKKQALKTLEMELRNIGELEIPPMLERKLLAAVPEQNIIFEPVLKLRQRICAMAYSTAAAILIMAVVVFLQNFVMSAPARPLITDPKDMSLSCTVVEEDIFAGLGRIITRMNEPMR